MSNNYAFESFQAKKPLSAKEARQLQREWLKRIRNGDQEDVSQYDNVKDHR